MGTGLANGISSRQMQHLKSNNQKIATTFLLQHAYGHILESVQSAKYMGVTLSADLKWNNHIQQMTSKANKSLSFIRCNL